LKPHVGKSKVFLFHPFPFLSGPFPDGGVRSKFEAEVRAAREEFLRRDTTENDNNEGADQSRQQQTDTPSPEEVEGDIIHSTPADGHSLAPSLADPPSEEEAPDHPERSDN
jgi:hypothetical protein